jgi:5-methyltetrahydropteroyltriglutamate--homocysteine methyltransferase
VDRKALERLCKDGMRNVVARQIDAGVDIVNDCEQPRAGFQTYIAQRMRGFGGESKRRRPHDLTDFPEFARKMAQRFPRRSKVSNAPQAVEAVRYNDLEPARTECGMMKEALADLPRKPIGTFMTAPSPGVIATTLLNAHYESHEAYVFALAREMRKEYEVVIDEGFDLQIDAPDLAMERTMMFQDKTNKEFVDIMSMHVAAINDAVQHLPRERIRLHCCWGNWEGPHVHDIPLQEILPAIYGARVGGLSLEFANPRHQHEYEALKRNPLPTEMSLLPGVIDSTSNYVEHPQVIANRICEALAAVGDRTRVIASSACGFGTFAGGEFVSSDVVWAKLAACREGARIASERLWGAPLQ